MQQTSGQANGPAQCSASVWPPPCRSSWLPRTWEATKATAPPRCAKEGVRGLRLATPHAPARQTWLRVLRSRARPRLLFGRSCVSSLRTLRWAAGRSGKAARPESPDGAERTRQTRQGGPGRCPVRSLAAPRGAARRLERARTGGSDPDPGSLDFPQGVSQLARTAILRSETLTLDLWTLELQPRDRIQSKRALHTGTAGCEMVLPQWLCAIFFRNWPRAEGARLSGDVLRFQIPPAQSVCSRNQRISTFEFDFTTAKQNTKQRSNQNLNYIKPLFAQGYPRPDT